MGYIWYGRVCRAKELLSIPYGYILPHFKVLGDGRRLCSLSFSFSFSFIAKYHLCDWKGTEPTVIRSDVMAFPGRQGTWAVQQSAAFAAVTSGWRSFQSDAGHGAAAMPTLLCRASTTWPHTSSQMRPDPLCKLTFPENGKDQSRGSTFKYREDCLSLFCCMREGLGWKINFFYVKRVTSTASTPFPAMLTFITPWLFQPICL